MDPAPHGTKTFDVYTHPSAWFEPVKRGFSWPAFFFPLIWTLVKRLWLIALLVFAVSAFLTRLGGTQGASPALYFMLRVVLGFIVGSYGNDWRRKKLIERGYALTWTVLATNPVTAVVEAEQSERRTLAAHENAAQPDNLAIGKTLNRLANLRQAQGDFAGAEPLYKRSLAILEESGGNQHPDVIQCMAGYASLLRRTSRSDEAAKIETRIAELGLHKPEDPASSEVHLPTCPSCGQAWNPEDYQGDAEHIYCSSCKQELRRRFSTTT